MTMGPKFVILSAYLCLVSCPLVFTWLYDDLPKHENVNYDLHDLDMNAYNLSLLSRGLPVIDPITVENKLRTMAFQDEPLSDDDRTILKIVSHNLRTWRADSVTSAVVEESLHRVHTWLYLRRCLDDAENVGLTVFKNKMMSDGWAKADRSKYESVEEFVKDMIEIHWAKRMQRWLFMFKNEEDDSLDIIRNFVSEVIDRFKSPESAAYEIEVFGVEINHCIQIYSGSSDIIVGENVARIENKVLAELLYSTLTANVLPLRYSNL